MSDANVGFILGYGGFCSLQLRYSDNGSVYQTYSTANGNRLMLPLTDGNYERSMQIPMQSPYTVPFSNVKRARFRTGMGTFSYSGNIGFELTSEVRDMIFNQSLHFFKRTSLLDIALCDGQGEIDVTGGVWNSFTLTAAAGELVQCSINFQSCNNFVHDIQVGNPNPQNNPLTNVNRSYTLEKYWQYGESGVQNFQLTFSREVQAIYLNEQNNWIGPSYLRVGLTDVSMNITCWEKWFIHNSIKLGSKTLTFNGDKFVSQKNYQLVGINGEGMKTYTNNAVGLSGAGDLFSIA